MAELLLICVLTGIAAGWIGASKGRSGFGFFLLGLFLNLIGVLIAIGVPSLKPVAVAGGPAVSGTVKCPGCYRPRAASSLKCVHCGNGPIATPGMKKCPACAELILTEAKKCKHCGEQL